MPERRRYDPSPLAEAWLAGYDAGRAKAFKSPTGSSAARKPKRKLSAWNKYVKANSKKPRFRYRNGKLNLKKMAVAFRKTPAGRKRRKP